MKEERDGEFVIICSKKSSCNFTDEIEINIKIDHVLINTSNIFFICWKDDLVLA